MKQMWHPSKQISEIIDHSFLKSTTFTSHYCNQSSSIEGSYKSFKIDHVIVCIYDDYAQSAILYN